MWKLTENFPDFTYWKSVFLDIFCPLLTLHLVALENLVWAHDLEPTWSLKIGFGFFTFIWFFFSLKILLLDHACSLLWPQWPQKRPYQTFWNSLKKLHFSKDWCEVWIVGGDHTKTKCPQQEQWGVISRECFSLKIKINVRRNARLDNDERFLQLLKILSDYFFRRTNKIRK